MSPEAMAHRGESPPRPPRTSHGWRRRAVPLLFVSGLVSSLFAVASVRLASPLTIDETPTGLLVFVLAPIILIVLLGLVRSFLGAVAAAALPFAWLAVVFGQGDSIAIWLLPVACAVGVWLLFSSGSRAPLVRGVGTASAIAVVIALLLPVPGPPADGTRVLLIGIDGASWQCVDAAIEAGRMPTVERLVEGGHRAKLRSLPSMFSPQVWSAIATGCMPRVNGIYGWGRSQADFRVGRVWDRMWMDGRTAGTCGWYFTWPPPDDLSARDFVVPSTLAPDSSAFPSNCGFLWQLWASQSGRAQSTATPAGSLANALRSGARLSTLRRAAFLLAGGLRGDMQETDRAWRARAVSAAMESDMFCELLRSRRPDLGVALFNQVDKVSHLYWKYREPSLFSGVTPEEVQRLGTAVELLYAEADRCIGKILRVVPDDANVVIVSDHGFRPAIRKVMGSFCRIRAQELIRALDADAMVLGTNLDQKAYLEIISGTEEERKQALDSLEPVLRDAHIAGEDTGLFLVARDGNTLVLEIAPRNAVPKVSTVILAGREFDFDSIISARPEARFSGEHAPDGVYLLSGPMTALSADTDSLSVLDVAPTVAPILGLPMSTVWTGRPAFVEAASEGLGYGDYPPPAALAAVRGDASNERLKEELRSLGYID